MEQELSIQQHLPIVFSPWSIRQHTGLVIVDVVNGFVTVGCGPLAPQKPNAQIDQMVLETNRLAHLFQSKNWPILAFLDTHVPGKSEPPYPPHCELGTGEEELVPDLKWLESSHVATLIKKDCINGFVGAIEVNEPRNINHLIRWVLDHDLQTLIVTGICTDICVMDLVLTLLSARNHGMLGRLKDIVVYEPGCATYDLPSHVVADLGLSISATHPQMVAHHMGLYCMASRGAVLCNEIMIEYQ